DFANALAIGPDPELLPHEGRTSTGHVTFKRVATLGCEPMEGSELPPLPGRDFDLIVSLLDLQIVNDVPGYLAQLARHLAPDGLLLAAALGGESLTELRRAFLSADAEA